MPPQNVSRCSYVHRAWKSASNPRSRLASPVGSPARMGTCRKLNYASSDRSRSNRNTSSCTVVTSDGCVCRISFHARMFRMATWSA